MRDPETTVERVIPEMRIERPTCLAAASHVASARWAGKCSGSVPR